MRSKEGKAYLKKKSGDKADKDSRAGTTATTILITSDKIYCANAGDSRSVLSKNGGAETIGLSVDHKPTDEEEKKRIEAAGGKVKHDRVDGNLAVSRGLGDFIFKDEKRDPKTQKVSPFPDVSENSKDGVDFIVLACDGVWEWDTTKKEKLGIDRSNEGVVKEIHQSIWDNKWADSEHRKNLSLDNMTEKVKTFAENNVCKQCTTMPGCEAGFDNVSTIVVEFM